MQILMIIPIKRMLSELFLKVDVLQRNRMLSYVHVIIH